MQRTETEHLKACPIYNGRKKADGGTIWGDLKVAAGIFVDMRKARKEGVEVEVKKTVQISFIQSGGFYNTVEGSVLCNYGKDVSNKAQEAFNSLPDEVKHRLQFSPKEGEYKERANLWRAILKPVMADKQYHVAMKAIVSWYIHIVKLRKGGAK